jgi:peptide/nickel transport system substrate-binding protein
MLDGAPFGGASVHRPRRAAWEAFAVAALLAGCSRGGAAREEAREYMTVDAPLEILVANDPETLDPRYATDAVGLRTTRLIHAGLTRLDPDTLAPIPYLAERWRWVDSRTLHVDLRTDLAFHSGAPFGSPDVVATLQAIASPRVASRQARVLDAIAEVRADGEHALIVRLARAHATLLTDLEVPILRRDQAAAPPAPKGTLDGLGPFTVRAVARGEVVLSPATGGPLPRPSHALVLRTVHDENTRALRLEVGRADVALNLISPTLLPALESPPALAVRSRDGANLTYMVVDEERPALGDARVRRAISMAIDRGTLTASLFDGRARPAGGLIAPAHWASSGAPALDFDPKAARALLAEAGALPLRATLLTSTERLRGDVARSIAQELGDVGVEVTVIPLELGTLIARLNGGDFDLAILQLPEMTEPNVLRHFLHSALVPPEGANRGRVRDAELDALLDAGDRESDARPETRRAIYARLEEHERAEMHLVPLWYEEQVVVTSPRARSFVPSAEGRWLGLAAVK